MAVLAFEESNYIATEAGPVEVCVVVLERLSQTAVEFELEAISGTAISKLIHTVGSTYYVYKYTVKSYE